MRIDTRLFTIIIYLTAVYLFSIFIKLLYYGEYLFCFHCHEVDYPDNIYDYIVVGSGSSGAVVARRLSDDPSIKVLLLEAGKHGTPLLDIPSLALLVQQSPFDWQYETVPQDNACLGLDNNASRWPMGRIVGGTGMLNNMIHVRGHIEDFKEWYLDQEHFDFEKHILPYFEKSESGLKGSTYVQNLKFSSKLPKIFLDAVKSIRFSDTANVENCAKGFNLPKFNTRKGARWTPAHHLVHHRKNNLDFRTGRLVRKVLLHDNYEAYGVQYSIGDELHEARARKGIILAAGVIGSPKILMHSGIGPKEHLREVGIEPRVDVPVGDNLQDHLTTGFDLIVLNQSLGIGLEQMFSPLSMLKYFWNGDGPWTTAGCEVIGFINTNTSIDRQDDSLQPDIQFMIMPLGMNEDRGLYLRKLIGISDDTWKDYFSLLNDSVTITMLPILLHPKSRGYVRLRDSNFGTEPVINPRYLDHRDDIVALVKGISVIKQIVATNPMKKLGARFNTNVYPSCRHLEYDSFEYWECYIRHVAITSYHPVGTCRMGSAKDSSSVVDYNFVVKNTNNLFVVDGSVMPTLTSGNINSAILMLAELASDMIKLRTFLSENHCAILEIFITRNYC